MKLSHRFATGMATAAMVMGCWAVPATSAQAAETLNVYSIWPEPYCKPMFKAFTKDTGIKVNFLRFSSGEALARIIAEKNNPKIDVLFGGPIETFAAGVKQGVFQAYKPPSTKILPARFKNADGYWTAIADDPLVFMTNKKFLAQHHLQPPTSWNDLLDPAYKNMLQMADARTSGTAVTRIFSLLEVDHRDEKKAFDYMKKLRKNIQTYTKSGGGGTVPIGLGQAAGGIFFIVDALQTQDKGYDVAISFPKEGIGASAEGIAIVKGAKHLDAAKKLVDWATSAKMQSLLAPNKINFVPANPQVKTSPAVAKLLATANIIQIDDKYAGQNRKRIVQKWVDEVLNEK